jgi:copper transport protein
VVLLVKLVLVALVLVVAAGSRRTVGRGARPRRTVRGEAVITVLVLAVTSVLASTVPPSTVPAGASTSGPGAPSTASDGAARFDLGGGRTALLTAGLTAGPTGGRLQVELRAPDGTPLAVRSVSLRAELPARELAPLEVPLRGGPATWSGRFRFPYPGDWRLTLTVELPDRTAVVSPATLRVG